MQHIIGVWTISLLGRTPLLTCRAQNLARQGPGASRGQVQ